MEKTLAEVCQARDRGDASLPDVRGESVALAGEDGQAWIRSVSASRQVCERFSKDLVGWLLTP